MLLGCSFGKGTLIYRDTGKKAYNFFNLKNGEKVRISLKGFAIDYGKQLTKGETQLKKEYILKAPLDEIFDFSQPKFELPEESRTFGNIKCEICGETVPEDKIRLQDGKKVCLDCFKGKW